MSAMQLVLSNYYRQFAAQIQSFHIFFLYMFDISFLSDYTGFEYGSEVLRNVRLKYAMELSQMV